VSDEDAVNEEFNRVWKDVVLKSDPGERFKVYDPDGNLVAEFQSPFMHADEPWYYVTPEGMEEHDAEVVRATWITLVEKLKEELDAMNKIATPGPGSDQYILGMHFALQLLKKMGTR
jgi:hypothetical protein